MLKIFTFILTFILFVNSSFSQIVASNHKIIDNIGKQGLQQNSLKRSAKVPTNCLRDTVEYPRYKGTGFYTLTINKGRALGQLYSTPKPLTLYGFSFYAFVANTPPSPKKLKLICNVYKAGSDSLPKGSPLRSDTITIDSTFGGGVLTKIEKHATFKNPIYLDSAYILTVESDSISLNAGLVVNNYAAGDGKKENLNCGSISGVWYNGKNLNVGGVPFNCDILLHPHVKYALGADFTIKNQCYYLTDTVKFTNLVTKNMSGSKMYNRYLIYNLGYYCNWWTTSDFSGYTFSVDHSVKYTQKQNYKIQLISTVYGYRGMQNGCSDTTTKLLYYKPDFPQVNGPSSACIGDSAKFTVTNADTGAVYEWYKKVTDSNPFFKGSVYKKFPLTKSDTFYLKGNNHGCYTSYRTIVLDVNAYPGTLSVKNDSICSGSKANLKGFTNIGNIEWFESAVSSTVLYTGNVYQTPVLTQDTFFYLHANNKGCIKSPRVKVSAMVGSNFAPAPPIVTKDTSICIASTSILTLNATAASGLTIRWFDAGSGSSSIATGANYFFTPTIREVKTYYADAYNGVCGSTRIPVVITVEDFPKITKKNSDTICYGDSLIMQVEIPFGEANWYDATTGGNLLYSGKRYSSMPVNSGNYYVETSSGFCKSKTRTILNGSVNTFPVVAKLWGDTICAKNKATLKSKLIGAGTMHWFEYDTSSVELGKGKTFQTFVLNGSKYFYGQPENAGCFGVKQVVSPLVKPTPVVGFSYEVFLATKTVKVTPYKPATSTFLWNFDDGSTSKLEIVSHKYANDGTYKIKLIQTETNACKDSVTIPVTIGVSGVPIINKLSVLKLYPNPTQAELNILLDNKEGIVNVVIYSLTGAIILNEDKLIEKNLIKFDVENLNTGLYLLKINGYQAIVFVKE